MNTGLRIGATSGAEVASQAPMTSSATIKARRSAKEAISRLKGPTRQFTFFRSATQGLSFVLAHVRRCESQSVNETRSRITEIAATELTKKKLRPVIIDVREEEEFLTGQICGAKHISRGSLNERIGHVVSDLTVPILVYCSRGDRGALAADSLRKMGYRNVYSLKGGLQHWLEAGGTLECPASRTKTSAQISHATSLNS
jgi:phage shock protein E